MSGVRAAVDVDGLHAEFLSDDVLPLAFHNHIFEEELHVGVFLPDFVQDSHIVKKQAAARIVEV